MSVTAVITLSLLVSVTSALLCDIPDDVRTPEVDGKFFSVERNSTCYVFAMKKVPVRSALSFCRSIGGQLTDVESKTNNLLQKLIIEEMTNHPHINTDYWIGLLWNHHVQYWYWDNGARQQLHIDYPSRRCLLCTLRACVVMTLTDLHDCFCTEERAFICKIDLDYYDEQATNNTECSQHCVDYIRKHKSTTPMISSTMATTPSLNENTTGWDVFGNTTGGSSGGNSSAHSRDVMECKATQEENKLVLIVLAVLGGLTAILLVTVIVMCTVTVKYRRMVNAKCTPTRISMVDILHADSPAAARRKRRSKHSSTLPDSTSEILYSNTYNTYSAPDSDDGQAAEASRLIHQENNYSEPSAPSASGGAPKHRPQLDHVGNEYTLLNRGEHVLDENDSHNVYGIESATAPVGASLETSDTYESYSQPH